MELNKTEEKDVKEVNKQENQKISKFIDKKTAKKVFINLIIAVLIMAYFCIISAVYDNVQETGIIRVIKISTMVFLGIALILIEFAFKRESKTLLIHTFESLAFALHSLTTVYITRVFKLDFKGYILISSYIFSIYYVLKAILINTKARKEYLNELSDISDIVKKEEPTKKEAFKKEKKNKKQKEERKEKNTKTKIIKESNVNDEIRKDVEEKIEKVAPTIEEPKQNDEKNIEEVKQVSKEEKTRLKNKKLADIRAKLRELQKQDEELKANIEKKVEKKEETKKEEKETKEEIEQAPKRKRGRPKKEVNEEIKPEEKEQIEQAPKRKRGRPKKEVEKND